VFKFLKKLVISATFLFLGVMAAVPSFAQNVDPTKPLSIYGIASSNNVEKSGELVLETIVFGNQVRTAIINGKLLKVGDTIGEHKVLIVNDKNVVLGRDDERLKLTLFSAAVVVKSP